MALGITQVAVAKRPRVGILATGDEVIDPHAEPQPGQVRDVNTYSIGGIVERAGGIAQPGGIIRDNFEALYEAARRALERSDALVLSAGSSVSVRDMTYDVIDQSGQPGVLVHGVSINPGKPTIVAVCDGKPVFGLPGNPVSAMVVGDLFITPTLWMLQGCDRPPLRQTIRARLSHNLASVPGRVDYIQVKLIERDGELWADPVFGKSNLIYTLVKADGMLIIPIDANGIAAGELVDVRLFYVARPPPPPPPPPPLIGPRSRKRAMIIPCHLTPRSSAKHKKPIASGMKPNCATDCILNQQAFGTGGMATICCACRVLLETCSGAKRVAARPETRSHYRSITNEFKNLKRGDDSVEKEVKPRFGKVYSVCSTNTAPDTL